MDSLFYKIMMAVVFGSITLITAGTCIYLGVTNPMHPWAYILLGLIFLGVFGLLMWTIFED